MRVVKSIGFVSIIVIALMSPQLARADECGNAVTDYNFLLSRLTDAMQRLSNCIADSKGLDRCSSEFKQLQSAYNEYAAAVSAYNKECL
jgi:hypothetical protein